MQKMYDHYKQQENTEVCVTPLPLFTKDPYGEITAQKEGNDRNDKREEYPDHLNVIHGRLSRCSFMNLRPL